MQKLPALITPQQSHQHSLQTSPYTHHPPLHPNHHYGNHICRKINHLKKTWSNEISEMLELVVLRDKQNISHPYPLCLKEIQQPSLSDLLSLSLSLSLSLWADRAVNLGVGFVIRGNDYLLSLQSFWLLVGCFLSVYTTMCLLEVCVLILSNHSRFEHIWVSCSALHDSGWPFCS